MFGSYHHFYSSRPERKVKPLDLSECLCGSVEFSDSFKVHKTGPEFKTCAKCGLVFLGEDVNPGKVEAEPVATMKRPTDAS